MLTFMSCTAPATPELYTLSLHDALPISPSPCSSRVRSRSGLCRCVSCLSSATPGVDDLSEDAPVAFTNLKSYRARSEEHTSELQSRGHLVCRLLLEKKKSSVGSM